MADFNLELQGQTNKHDDEIQISCCTILFSILYFPVIIIFNLIPVIAQIKALYILCNHQKYLSDNVDSFDRNEAHFYLFLNGYGGIYIVIRAIYEIWKFTSNNINNKDNFWKRHLAQTFAGLIIFKILYELVKLFKNMANLGNKYVYSQNEEERKLICGHILLMFCTCGLFIPFRLIQLTIIHFNNKNYWIRQVAQLLAGLIIFKIIYELWAQGRKYVYGIEYTLNNGAFTQTKYDKHLNDPYHIKSFMGHICLTIITCGFFIPFRTIQLIIIHFNDKNYWVRQLAQFVGGFIIFKVIYELWAQGRKYVYGIEYTLNNGIFIQTEYDKQTNDPYYVKSFIGHIYLTIITCAVFVPYRYIEFSYNNFYSTSYWVRQLSQFMGGFVILKIMYELWAQGRKYVYGIEYTLNNGVFTQTEYDKQTNDPYYTKSFIGHIYLTIITCALFVPFRIYQLAYLNFTNKNYLVRQFAQFVAGLILFKILYELWANGIKYVYKIEYVLENESFKVKDKINIDDSFYVKLFFGHLCLTVITCGLFIPYRICELVYTHFTDEDPIKRHCAQLVAGLIVFKLYYELFKLAYKWTYLTNDEKNTYCYNIGGNMLLSLSTFGIYPVYKLVEFVTFNFNSPISWKKHIAQTIGLLIIGKIYFEMFIWGIELVYPQQAKSVDENLNNKHVILGTSTNNESIMSLNESNILNVSINNQQNEQNEQNYIKVPTAPPIIELNNYTNTNANVHNNIEEVTNNNTLIVENVPLANIIDQNENNKNNELEYNENSMNCAKQIMKKVLGQVIGHIFLTICSIGTFIPYRIVELIYTNWDSKDPIKQEIAKTFGYLIVPRLWYQAIFYGTKFVYDVQYNNSNSVYCSGIFLLTFGTIGLFIPYYIVEQLCYGLNSNNWYTKQFSETICGLIIFKTWYELYSISYKWVYLNNYIIEPNIRPSAPPLTTAINNSIQIVDHQKVNIELINDQFISKDTSTKNASTKYININENSNLNNTSNYYEYIIKQICGHLGLIITTLSVFFFFRIAELIYTNWDSKTRWKQELAKLFGFLIIFRIWYIAFYYGNKFVYDSEQNKTLSKYFLGLFFLTMSTFLLFIPFYFCQQLYYGTHSANWYTRHFCQTICGLIVFKIWYELIVLSYTWIYKNKYVDKLNIGLNQQLELEDNHIITNYNKFVMKQIGGHLILTICTLLLFAPYRLCEFTYINWNSDIKWKQELAKFFGYLIIFRLWYLAITNLWKQIYNENNGNNESNIFIIIMCQLCLTILTFGVYAFIMIIEFFDSMINTNLIYMRGTPENTKGIIQATILTCGLAGPLFGSTDKNKIIRYISRLILVAINIVFITYITYCTLKLNNKYQCLALAMMCIVSYPCYLIFAFTVYNYTINESSYIVFKLIAYYWYKSKYNMQYVIHGVYSSIVYLNNGRKIMWSNTKTSIRRSYAQFRNITLRWMRRKPIRTPDDPKYRRVKVSIPKLIIVEAIDTVEQKMDRKYNGEKAIRKRQKANILYCINCVYNNIVYEYYNRTNIHPLSKYNLWHDRYLKIDSIVDLVEGLNSENFKKLFDKNISNIFGNEPITNENYQQITLSLKVALNKLDDLYELTKINNSGQYYELHNEFRDEYYKV
jgi:hypothetical protein